MSPFWRASNPTSRSRAGSIGRGILVSSLAGFLQRTLPARSHAGFRERKWRRAAAMVISGQVPQHPERSKRNAVATATTSRTLIPDMCPTSHRVGDGGHASPSGPAERRVTSRQNTLRRWALGPFSRAGGLAMKSVSFA
jgi:hypothetical protein